MTRHHHHHHYVVEDEEGGMHPPETEFRHMKHHRMMVAFCVILLAGLAGAVGWLAYRIHLDNKYFVAPATQRTVTVGGVSWREFATRAAEPYNGRPAAVLDQVTALSQCTGTTNTSSGTTYPFFTYDKTNQKCYFYEGGLMDSPNASTLIIGPTTKDKHVYVKNDQRYVELLGALRDGQ